MMKAFLIAAGAALPLLAGPAFAQGEVSSVFTNAPNEMPWSFRHDGGSRQQADAASPFGYSEAKLEPQDRTTTAAKPPLQTRPPFTLGGVEIRVWAPVAPSYNDEANGDLAARDIWGKPDVN